MECPSFERLLDYLDGRLPAVEADHISAHLAAGCHSCAANRNWYEGVRNAAASDDSIEPPAWVLKRAHRIFENESTRPRLIEGLGQAVASLIFDSLARPAIAGARSTDNASRQLLYRAGDYNIDLQISSSGESGVDLIGQILREGEFAFESVAGLPLEIIRENKTAHSTMTNALGEFSISGLCDGEYDLHVETTEGSITARRLLITRPQ